MERFLRRMPSSEQKMFSRRDGRIRVGERDPEMEEKWLPRNPTVPLTAGPRDMSRGPREPHPHATPHSSYFFAQFENDPESKWNDFNALQRNTLYKIFKEALTKIPAEDQCRTVIKTTLVNTLQNSRSRNALILNACVTDVMSRMSQTNPTYNWPADVKDILMNGYTTLSKQSETYYKFELIRKKR